MQGAYKTKRVLWRVSDVSVWRAHLFSMLSAPITALGKISLFWWNIRHTHCHVRSERAAPRYLAMRLVVITAPLLTRYGLFWKRDNATTHNFMRWKIIFSDWKEMSDRSRLRPLANFCCQRLRPCRLQWQTRFLWTDSRRDFSPGFSTKLWRWLTNLVPSWAKWQNYPVHSKTLLSTGLKKYRSSGPKAAAHKRKKSSIRTWSASTLR